MVFILDQPKESSPVPRYKTLKYSTIQRIQFLHISTKGKKKRIWGTVEVTEVWPYKNAFKD
jgi:hypothetical protein